MFKFEPRAFCLALSLKNLIRHGNEFLGQATVPCAVSSWCQLKLMKFLPVVRARK